MRMRISHCKIKLSYIFRLSFSIIYYYFFYSYLFICILVFTVWLLLLFFLVFCYSVELVNLKIMHVYPPVRRD